MDKKYGVYICTGCGIGEALDVKAMCDVPEEEGVSVRTHPCFCGKGVVDGVINNPFLNALRYGSKACGCVV